MAKEKSETKGKKGRLSRERKQEVVGVLLVLLSLLVLASLVSYSQWEPFRNWAGPVGHNTAWGLFGFLGFAAFAVPLLGILWGWNRFRNHAISRLFINTLLSLGVVLSAILFLSLPDFSGLRGVIGFEPGGLAGRQLAALLIGWVGYLGTILVTSGLLLVTFLVTTEVNIQRPVSRVTGPVKGYFSPEAQAAREKAKQEKARAEAEEKANKEREKQEKARAKEAAKAGKPVEKIKVQGFKGSRVQGEPGIKTGGEDSGKERKKTEAASPVIEGVAEVDAEYREGFLNCLEDVEGESVSGEDKSEVLTSKLAEFGVEGKVVGRLPGPIITRYEFQPAPGIKISQVMNLSDDLALALKAQRIRIVGPIPGRGAVGIEIPNEKRAMVRLKTVLLSPAFEGNPSPIHFALGKDTTGQPFCADLTEMPHLLVAGATGSGKSVALNALIASILYRASPQQVHFIMIDPKRIELSAFRGIPHLRLRLREDGENGGGELEGVVTSSQEVVRVFRLAVNLMDERYQLLAKAGARNIEDYNRKDEVQKKLPYLVIVVDELADLMLSREASEIENQIAKLAQMARAVGIHLVVATQRPSVDVITGVIKANFPCRIAFQVASKTDSRTILDVNGAESLLGRGDMLFLPPGQAEPVRLHGNYLSGDEVGAIVAFLKEWYGVEEGEEEMEDHSLEVAAPGEGLDGERDPLYEEARALVLRHQLGSTSLLQRRLKVGYSRAGRLMDQLEGAGIVGPFDGSKARKVLVKLDGAPDQENAN
jgi:S-DNA-T family DNA segregation ATPase FtsK/SpoIIIE